MSVKSKPKKNRTVRKHPSWTHWYDSITSAKVRHMCHEVGMRSTQLLPEELRGTVQWVVEYLTEEPLTLERLHTIVPPFMRNLKTEPLVDERMLKAAYPKLSDPVLHELHRSVEGFLVTLIKEGAEVAKENKLKSIQPKHVNKIRLKYFTLPEDE